MRRVLPFLILSLALGWCGYLKWTVEKKQNHVLGIEVDLAGQTQYWERIATDSPTYRDAWVELTLLSIQNKDTTKAQEYLTKVLEIDPNWEIPITLLSSLPQ